MTGIFAFLVGRTAGPIFAALALALVIANGVQWGVWSWQVSLIERDRDDYKARIEDPTTGYVRQVSQCLTNHDDLKGNLERLSGEVKDLAAADRARDEQLQKDVVGVRNATRAAQAKANTPVTRMATIGTLEACQAGMRAVRGRP